MIMQEASLLTILSWLTSTDMRILTKQIASLLFLDHQIYWGGRSRSNRCDTWAVTALWTESYCLLAITGNTNCELSTVFPRCKDARHFCHFDSNVPSIFISIVKFNTATLLYPWMYGMCILVPCQRSAAFSWAQTCPSIYATCTTGRWQIIHVPIQLTLATDG